ncbi:hypothetical protein JKP88DRAFT_265281 [Tribonema minus]|uniref:Uncharacterized protein n=1 Tax=Tribonema minus TaxID=303371 RepID=A0A836C968_9STRA|nr:hypothetical protein JKP88DRAFT_265281 [Tribonema minus]
MASRFSSLASVVSAPCFAWLRYYSFIKRGSDELELVRQAVADGTEEEQRRRIWQLLETTVLKGDIIQRRHKNESALRTFKYRLMPILHQYALATLGPVLPYSVKYTQGKQLGAYVRGDASLSSQQLEASGLKGWVEPLSSPFNATIATTMGYPSCINDMGWDGLLYGPMSLLNEADNPVKSLFQFKSLPAQDLRADSSVVSSKRVCQPVHMRRKFSGGTESTRVRVVHGDEITVCCAAAACTDAHACLYHFRNA